MARLFEITPEAQAWIDARPEVIKAVIAKCPPNLLYRLRDSGRVTIYSYSEDGTVTVNVTGEYNLVMFERQVFGINPDDLTECDLPGADELIGAALTEDKDVDAFIADRIVEMHERGEKHNQSNCRLCSGQPQGVKL